MIYDITWYNEDGYGVTSELRIVIQGENESNVTLEAIEYLKKNNNITDDDFDKYDKFAIKEVTDQKVIAVSMNRFC